MTYVCNVQGEHGNNIIAGEMYIMVYFIYTYQPRSRYATPTYINVDFIVLKIVLQGLDPTDIPNPNTNL